MGRVSQHAQSPNFLGAMNERLFEEYNSCGRWRTTYGDLLEISQLIMYHRNAAISSLVSPSFTRSWCCPPSRRCAASS